jgi:hypothetical protein
MEEKWYNPIEFLKPGVHSLMNHLSSGLSPELQQTINSIKIQFIYDNEPLPLSTPKVELETHRIKLQDTHMAVLWCWSYVTVALNSITYKKADLDQDVVMIEDVPEFKKVSITIGWARSLKEKISWWPADAGRPDVTDQYTEAANNLYQACVCFLLFHEIGHVIMHNHLLELATRRLNPFYELTSEDRKQIYDAEVEADQFALDCLLGNSTLEDVRMVKYIGAVLAQLSTFYMLDTPDTRGGTHPDYDVRLRAILRQANLKTEASRIQLSSHVSVGLQLFFKLTGKKFISENTSQNNYKNFEELEAYLFGLIDNMKKASR